MAASLRDYSLVCTTSCHISLPETNSIRRKKKKSHLPIFREESCQNTTVTHSSSMESVVSQTSICCPCKRLEIQGLSHYSWSRRRNNVVASFSSETGFICEKEGDVLMQSREDQHNSYKQKQSLLVTPMALEEQQEFSVEPIFKPTNINSERKFPCSEVKLQFIEEKDEELLSKRILKLSRGNKVRSALELYMSMEASGLQASAHACNSLLSCLLRNGSFDDAFRVFKIMEKKEVATGHTYSLILKAVASAQGCDSALEMFKALEGGSVKKKNFDVIAYNTMISVCAKAKKWVEAERIWRKLKENGCSGTLNTYRLLVSTFVQCGQTELALDAYGEMIQSGMEEDEDSMKAVIASCTKEGKWDLALNIFQRNLKSGMKPNIIVCNALINCLGKAGEEELAFRVYDLMKSLGLSPDEYTWSALLNALHRSQQYTDALLLFEAIRKEHSNQLNCHLYNIALMSCQRLGLWERALQLLWQMETIGLLMTTVSYNHAISACEAARKPRVALQLYQHMTHRKCTPDIFTYLSLIRTCIWESLWTEVEEILEGVEPDVSIYNAVIHGCCLRGKITMAKKLYQRMQSCGLKPDGKTRALMLQHLSKDRRRSTS